MADFKKRNENKYSPGLFSKKSCNSVSPTPPSNSVGFIASEVDPVPENAENGNSKRKKYSRWYLLKKRLTKKGVVPVNKDHPRYKLLSCIREGLRAVAQSSPSVSSKNVLAPEDFGDLIKKKISYEGEEFEFESYASPVFATIRQAVGVDEQEFINSVAPYNLPYLEFISNSKSGQDFFLSHNMQFMFKSNRPRDVKFFLSILRDYMQHFISYPHSLLVKYVGCYAIKLKRRPRKYFLVMQSIFYPAGRIEDRFDIKGCTAGRYQKPCDPESHIVTVLKDQNFLHEELDFREEGQWFIEQIKADSSFLCNFSCMDYSLLIGRQKKQLDEKQTEPVSTIIDRIGKSISPTRKRKVASLSSGGSPDSYKADLTHCDNNNSVVCFSQRSSVPGCESIELSDTPEEISREAVSSVVIIPQGEQGLLFPRSLADGVNKFKEEHRRLLPKCHNGLHIIDGQDYRYYLGIVDFLTRFDWRQKCAQYWKMIKYGCGNHSTKKPNVYSQRFIDFLSSRVK